MICWDFVIHEFYFPVIYNIVFQFSTKKNQALEFDINAKTANGF